MTLAYSYLRFSTPGQAEGDSIRRQTAAAQEWCERNGVRLDKLTTLRDLGKSAFTGSHRENPDRNALASFLQLVEKKKIARGSFLIVESLDRLTREHIQPALVLMLTLLQAGIKIVQLKPVEMIFDEKSDTLPIILMVVELSRGNSESEVKSARMLEVWEQKKRRARESKAPLTRNAPSWLAVKDDRFEVMEERARIIREIFQLAICGYGTYVIAQKLNREGVAPINGRGKWTRTYIRSILRDGRAKGEHQPCLRSKGKRVPQAPIPNYYPSVVDEQTWVLAQEALDKRRVHRGGSVQRVNIFHGLLRDAVNGGNYWVSMAGGPRGSNRYRLLVNDGGNQGTARFATFQFDVFEQAILEEETLLVGLFLEQKPDEGLTSLFAEKTAVERQLRKVEAQLELDSDVTALTSTARKLERRLSELNERIAKASKDAGQTLAVPRNLADVLLSAPNPDDARIRIRGAYQRAVEGVWLVVAGVAGSTERVCIAQIRYRDAAVRTLVITYCRPRTSHGTTYPRQLWVKSTNGTGGIDLRERKQALELEGLIKSHGISSRAVSNARSEAVRGFLSWAAGKEESGAA